MVFEAVSKIPKAHLGRHGLFICSIDHAAQCGGTPRDAFSAISNLRKSRFMSSKPSISASEADEKFIRVPTAELYGIALKTANLQRIIACI